MCDDLNTTDIIETECWLCPDKQVCDRFSKSFISRCEWRRVFPMRCDDDNNCDGVCNDGMDYMQAGFSPFVSMTGWLLFVYGLGWLRKERGKFAMLRRHGVQVTADMVGRRTGTRRPMRLNPTATARTHADRVAVLAARRFGDDTHGRRAARP